jgi:hypothetical protein
MINAKGRLLWSVALIAAPCLRGDEITEWYRISFQAARTAGISPLVTTRVNAIVGASIFNAVDGIERRYEAIHVQTAAPFHGRQAADLTRTPILRLPSGIDVRTTGRLSDSNVR